MSSDAVHAQLVEEVTKFLRRAGGVDSEFPEVMRRQLPVAERVVIRDDLRGEVMDYVVQQIDDTNLPHGVIWAIAAKVANKIYEDIPSDIQINALNTVAKRELDSLLVAIQSNPSVLGESKSSISSSISVKALRNGRRTMEDRHVVLPDLNSIADLEPTTEYQYYAVFDGHGGRDAANYCAAHLHIVMAEQIRAGKSIPDAIRAAFKIVDENYGKRSSEISRNAGSTGVVAVIANRNVLHVGWLGDSEAVLARGGSAVGLVQSHKPSCPEEQERIAKLGGTIDAYNGIHRVNGILAVSRAVGDIEHKPFVSSDAEVTTVPLDDSCDFLVLGCDGLFDNLTYADVVSNAYNAALTRSFDTSGVADQLTQAAIQKGSTDNITTVMVTLRDPRKWHFESVVAPKTDEPVHLLKPQLSNGGSNANENICSDTAALTGGGAGDGTGGTQVHEVAAGFVSNTVELALNKVNGGNGPTFQTPGNLDLAACDLSPPEEEQRELISSLKNDTPEADRLNPDAPEFVPLGAAPLVEDSATPSILPETPIAADPSPAGEPAEAVPPPTTNGCPDSSTSPAPAGTQMPKSESRDELVYEIDRQIGTAPQPVQAELVNLDLPSVPAPPVATEPLSDSDEELNSMVVHEDQPQPDLKLSELIVRDQHIHVIPEESPSEEVAPPVREIPVLVPQASTTQPAVPDITISEQNGGVAASGDKSPPSSPVQESGPVTANEAENISNVLECLEQEVAANAGKPEAEPAGAVAHDLLDMSSQMVSGELLQSIESSSAAAAPPFVPKDEPDFAKAPAAADYLFSTDGAVREEPIVPRAQPLLYDDTESGDVQIKPEECNQFINDSLIDALDNMRIEGGPKVVDAIEKAPDAPVAEQQSEPAPVEQSIQEKQRADVEPVAAAAVASVVAEALQLGGNMQDLMAQLNTSDAKAEEAVAAPVIPDSVPEAEGVQDADSDESDNDAQGWSFVKPVPAAEPLAAPAEPAAKTTDAPAKPEAAPVKKAATPAAKKVPTATKAATSPATKTAKPSAAVKPTTAKAAPKTAVVKPTTATAAPAKPTAATRTTAASRVPSAGAAKTTTTATKAPSATSAARPASKLATSTTAAKPGLTKPAASTAAARPASATSAVRPVKPTSASTTTARPTSAATKTSTAAKPTTGTAAARTATARPASTTAATRTTAAPSARPPTTATRTSLAAKPATTATAGSATKPTAAARTTTAPSAAARTAVARSPAKTATSATAAAKKLASTTATTGTAAPAASRVAAARAAAARPASGATGPTAAAKAKAKDAGAAKGAASPGPVKAKSPVKKATKQETPGKGTKSSAAAPAAKGKQDSKEAEAPKPTQNGSAPTPAGTNGHVQDLEMNPADTSGATEVPSVPQVPSEVAGAGEGDLLV